MMKRLKRLIKILGNNVDIVLRRKKKLKGKLSSRVDLDLDLIDIERLNKIK